jgi:hypothetical protein
LLLCWRLYSVSPELKPNKINVVEVMQKADSNSPDGTKADSEQKDENLFVSQHSNKALMLYRKAFRAGQ